MKSSLLTVIAVIFSVAISNAQEAGAAKRLTTMKSVCMSLEEFIVRAENDRLTAMATYSRNLENARATDGDVQNALKELSDSNKAWDTAIMDLAVKWDKLSCAMILYSKP